MRLPCKRAFSCLQGMIGRPLTQADVARDFRHSPQDVVGERGFRCELGAPFVRHQSIGGGFEGSRRAIMGGVNLIPSWSSGPARGDS